MNIIHFSHFPPSTYIYNACYHQTQNTWLTSSKPKDKKIRSKCNVWERDEQRRIEVASGEKGGGEAFQRVVAGGAGHACGVAAGFATNAAATAAAAHAADAFSGGDNGPSHGLGLLPHLIN